MRRLAVVGTYPPRQCGIATFTADLGTALCESAPEADIFAVSIDDREGGYDYPSRVHFQIREREQASYRQAADFLNIMDVDTVLVQHEFGIFGGTAGGYILELLRHLRMPAVATLHTVPRDPDRAQRRVIEGMSRACQQLVVMSQRGADLLREIYGLSETCIDIIPHGIPDVPFVDPNFHKDRFGVEGRKVLLTFGLISPGKGIEDVIRSLPAIRARHPEVVYLVVGATHPHIRARDGEAYRQSLLQLAAQMGVGETVVFHNRFVTQEELIEFIGAADIYLTPYISEAQVTSGTLAYATGAGKAVVSTPYWHAQELLADGRGRIVPFRDPVAIANAVIDLLDDPVERHAMRKRAYLHARGMIWPKVAEAYLGILQRVRSTPPTIVPRPILPGSSDPQEINLTHLRRLTDSTGLLQHASFTIPNYNEGYATDDNARGLLLCALLAHLGGALATQATDLAHRYLSFLRYAWNPHKLTFRNFMAYERVWREDVGSDDCQGRCLWALGAMIGRGKDQGLLQAASWLFGQALPAALHTASPRAWSFALLGLHEYMRHYDGDRIAREVRAELAGRLMALRRAHTDPDWPWFEDRLTYCNAALPHALLMAGHWMGDSQMRSLALDSLSWLCACDRNERGLHAPVGNDGFWPRGGVRAQFDQQPVEAYSTLSACLEAWRCTGEERWYDEARRCFDWFTGRNVLGLPLVDLATGGCRDGLRSDRCNLNQGAESTLAWLLAAAELHLADDVLSANAGPGSNGEAILARAAAPGGG